MRFFQKNTTLFAKLGYFIPFVILFILAAIAIDFWVMAMAFS